MCCTTDVVTDTIQILCRSQTATIGYIMSDLSMGPHGYIVDHQLLCSLPGVQCEIVCSNPKESGHIAFLINVWYFVNMLHGNLRY